MKRVIVIFIILTSLTSFSANPFGPSKVPFGKSKFYVEFLGGVTMPEMIYTDPNFSSLKSENYFDKNGGVAIRMQFCHMFSVGSQFTYRSLGVNFMESQEYQLNANYLNVFVPLEFEFNAFGCKKKTCTKALLFAGPYFSSILNGKLSLDGNVTKLTATDFNKYDYGAEAGLGIRIPTFSANGRSNLIFKVSYYYGLADTYPASFSGYSSNDMNNMLLSATGDRFNRGFRATISLELPLVKKSNSTFVGGGDGKKTYKRFVNIK